MSVFNWTAPLFKLAGRRWTQEDFSQYAEKLRPYVPPGGVLADLGGGTGDLGAGIARVLEANLIVLDPTKQMLLRVQAHPLISVRLASAEDLPFPDAYFDGLICSDAFHHVRDQQAAAREIARVVRPGGGVIMMEFEPGGAIPALERLLGEPAGFLSGPELARLLAEVGIQGKIDAHGRSYLYVGTTSPGLGGSDD